MKTTSRDGGRLRALMAEAGMTGQALADAVNRVGRESGSELRYDRTAVAHWQRGVRPRPPVPEFVAEALSRKLGRRITPEEAGFCPDGHSASRVRRATEPPEDVVGTFEGLAAPSALGRHAVPVTGAFNLLDLSSPGWLSGRGSAAPPIERGDDRVRRTGSAEIAFASAMTGMFSDMDAAFGGGRVLAALSGYLAGSVGPWLGAAGGTRARRGLASAAARLSYLAGFMCFDENQHARAQRYYVMSLRLAREAGDQHAYAVGLRALSVQARVLGHHRQAVDLAQAAVDSAPSAVPDQTKAFLHSHLAVAHAAAGDHRAAATGLILAERHMERAETESVAVGAFHEAALAHCRAALLIAAKDTAGAIAALSASLHHRPASERRSRALLHGQLAELHWSKGHVAAACSAWTLFLDDYAHLDSGRANDVLKNLKALTRPQSHRPEVAALRRRVTSTGRVWPT